jgi:uridine kinase
MEATKESTPPNIYSSQDALPDSSNSTGRLDRAHYSPPWANTSIIGIAGSSGSGKTSLAYAIIKELSLPWVVILSMDSFYKPLTPEESAAAFRCEYDFDAPEAIDFDVLVDRLRDIKSGYVQLWLICKASCANPSLAKRQTSLSILSRSMHV